VILFEKLLIATSWKVFSRLSGCLFFNNIAPWLEKVKPSKFEGVL